MPFKNENINAGLPKGSNFQVGQSDVDANANIEQGVEIPWAASPAGSYVYYDCTVGVMLDSGIVVHNRLPQVNNIPDSLAAGILDVESLDQIIDQGVNLKSNDQFTDIMQRMAHSRYWFRIWGQALRIGYKVPIPGIKTIGGQSAVPHDNNPQWACNRIAPGANYGGIILWHAQWSLWYTVIAPPNSQYIPVVDLAAHISGATTPPNGMQAPYSQADDSSQNNGPLGNPLDLR